MKITSEKHNHKLTNLLKVFIFSVLMLLPFINIAVRCGYVMLNKNAYHSYYGETINETTYSDIDTFNNVDYYNFFALQGGTFENQDGNTTIYISDFKDNDNLPLTFTPNAFLYYITNNTVNIQFLGENSERYSTSTQNYTLNFNYHFISNTSGLPLSLLKSFSKKINYNNYSYLDNVFEYSLNKLEQEQYITWTQNTAVYTGVNAMTTGLGITQTVIPMLIVYWFILTIIYIIIDIVLALFTKLTHMIGNKTT